MFAAASGELAMDKSPKATDRTDLPAVAGTEAPATGSGPQIFGRSEDGGGVLGLKVPIPADRNASGATARYGAGQ